MEFKENLIELIIRVEKNQASFLYFILEANDGICFYSTLDSSLKEGFRDIKINATHDFKQELIQVLKNLQKKMTLDIIESSLPEIP